MKITSRKSSKWPKPSSVVYSSIEHKNIVIILKSNLFRNYKKLLEKTRKNM